MVYYDPKTFEYWCIDCLNENNVETTGLEFVPNATHCDHC